MSVEKSTLLFIILFSSLAALAGGNDDPYKNVPIGNFHLVSPGIFRGARPNLEGIAALQKLGIMTVLDLEDDSSAVSDEYRLLAEIPLAFQSNPFSALFAPRNEDINQALTIVADPSERPIFVHDVRGFSQTGLVIGLYRVLKEKMPPKDAYDEMLKYGFRSDSIFLKEYFEQRTGYKVPSNGSI